MSADEQRAPLLLHSLAEFRELILGCLDIVEAERVVEVGGEDATLTRHLVAWAEKHSAAVVCVDPKPGAPLRELAATTDRLELVEDLSVNVLGGLGADVVVLDGDHNYYTVACELELLDQEAVSRSSEVLVLLHDVGWPSGRRDQYYDPSSLPADQIHEHHWDRGVVVGDPGTVEGGFRGAGAFAVAGREGGPRNGVLTAVEDFLESRPHLRLVIVPVIFGFGILYDSRASYAGALAALLEPYGDSPLLERLENNRLDLYLRVLEFQDRLIDVETGHAALAEAYETLRVERDGLVEEGDVLRRERDALRQERDLLHDRQVALEEQHRRLTLDRRDVEVERRALWSRVEELEAKLEPKDTPAPGEPAAPTRRLRRFAAALRRLLRSAAPI